MLKNQKGFHLLLPLLTLFILGAVIFVGFKVSHNADDAPSADKRGQKYHALQTCGKTPLNTLPADLSQLEQIAPLGNIDPPGHTLPTDHMYMVYPYGATDQRELYAPADVVVTAVSYGDVKENGVPKTSDYKLSMYPCRELQIMYGHVDKLGDKIAAKIGTPDSPTGARCNTSQQGAEEIKNCNWDVDIRLSAGDIVGTSNGWDLWATLEGHEPSQVVSPEYYHNVDAVCPLDYFTDTLKSQLYALVKRTAEPRCGEAYQDKAGSLQGGWFAHKDPQKAKTDWSSHLSLAHHSQTGIGLLAVAGTIADQFMYSFTPSHEGTINREPSETVIGTVYCYQHEGPQRMPNGRMAGTGKVLLKTIDKHTMQAEHQDGACAAKETFSKATTYYR